MKEIDMTSVDVKEYLNRPLTDEEVKARVAWYHDWSKRLDDANREAPLPVDIMDYCEGRKFRPLAAH
jgi:hypothetical protein